MKYEEQPKYNRELRKFGQMAKIILYFPILLAMGTTTIDFKTQKVRQVLTNINAGIANAVQNDTAVTIGDGETAGVITEAGVGYKVLDFNRPGKKGGATVIYSHTVNTENGKFDVRGNRKSIEIPKGDIVTIPGTEITVTSF